MSYLNAMIAGTYMIKIKYLKKTVETYEVKDPTTHGDFKVVVTEGMDGIYFELSHTRVMSPDGIAEAIELLKELIQNDCFNPIARNGEKQSRQSSKKVLTNINLNEPVVKMDIDKYIKDMVDKRDNVLDKLKSNGLIKGAKDLKARDNGEDA